VSELSVSELADMRRTSQLLMPESWSLVHPTEVSTSEGTTQTWAVTASGTRAAGTGGRLMPAGYQASEVILAGRPGALGAWIITLPAGEDPQPQDRIIIGTALTVGASVADFAVYSRVFEVVGDSAGHTFESAVKVSAVEVD
jgi:hypothetical protein